MYTSNEIMETINMVSHQHLDVRTITMGISLLDCITDDKKRTADKIYDKIMRRAGNLVAVGNAISSEIGVPIVNKRISITPLSLVTAASKGHEQALAALDKAAAETGIDFLGGYSALVHKGMTPYEREFLLSIPDALASSAKICSSVNVASTKAGINMDAVALAGKLIKKAAYLTRDTDSSACSKLVVFANAVEDNPFMAGAFLGVGEADCVINVGVSGPGVVAHALKQCDGMDLTQVAEVIKETAFKITRVGQLVAKEASRRLGAEFGIVDLSLAPTPAVGDSVAQILEIMGLESVGAYGTTATLALLNDAVKKGGIMASSHVGGLSGAFIPVSEDAGMIKAAEEGILTLEKLEAMTAVCSVGLDMIAIPGDVSEEIISAMIADEISIGVINTKTTAVRVIPVYGKKAGERAVFGGLLGEAPIMEVNRSSPAVFVGRGGRIPAPTHSLKN